MPCRNIDFIAGHNLPCMKRKLTHFFLGRSREDFKSNSLRKNQVQAINITTKLFLFPQKRTKVDCIGNSGINLLYVRITRFCYSVAFVTDGLFLYMQLEIVWCFLL